MGWVCAEQRRLGSGNVKKQISRLSYCPTSVLLSCPLTLLDPEASYLPAFAESQPDLEKQGHRLPMVHSSVYVGTYGHEVTLACASEGLAYC